MDGSWLGGRLRLARRCGRPRRPSGTSWVEVDGKGASGKTTLAARIAAALPGSVMVHIDDFARPDVRGWERDRFVRQVVRPLLPGDRAGISAGTSTATSALNGTPFPPGCRWSWRSIGDGRTAGRSVGLHDLGRGAVRGPL